MRKNPDKVRELIKCRCYSESRKGNTFLDRASTFSGKNEMSFSELEYMLQCAKETRERKTW